MVRRLPVPFLLLALVLAVAACGTSAPTPSPPVGSPAPTPPVGSPAPTPPGEDAAPLVASWSPGGPQLELAEGWVLADCDGDAPMLCAYHDGETAGKLELSNFPLTPALAAAADAAALAAALRDFADEHAAAIEADRAAGCGDGYAFAAEPAVAATVGGLPGIRFGFTGTQDGTVTEHVRSYATVAAGQLWIVTADAAAAEGCMATELLVFEPADLAALLPTIDRVVAGTPLPVAGARVEEGTVVGIDGGLAGGLVYVVVDGRKQRIQQPRAMTASDVTAEGLRFGGPVTHLRDAGASTGSSFVIVPPDGTDVRLHLLVDGVLHPLTIQELDPAVAATIPDADGSVLDRLTPADA